MGTTSTSVRGNSRLLDLLSGSQALLVLVIGFICLYAAQDGSVLAVAVYFVMLPVILPLRPLRIADRHVMASFCALIVALALGGFGTLFAISYRDTYVFVPPVLFYLRTVPPFIFMAYALGVAWLSFRAESMPSKEPAPSVAWIEGRE